MSRSPRQNTVIPSGNCASAISASDDTETFATPFPSDMPWIDLTSVISMRDHAVAPIERGLDDEIDLRVARSPTTRQLGFGERGNEYGRISLTAQAMADARVVLGHPLHGFDQLKDTGADTGPEIENMRATSRNQHFSREQMGLRQIVDVDIIPDCTAIRRGKIRSKNRKGPVGAAGGLYQERDLMRLPLPPFPPFSPRVAAFGLEVTPGCGWQSQFAGLILHGSLAS